MEKHVRVLSRANKVQDRVARQNVGMLWLLPGFWLGVILRVQNYAISTKTPVISTLVLKPRLRLVYKVFVRSSHLVKIEFLNRFLSLFALNFRSKTHSISGLQQTVKNWCQGKKRLDLLQNSKFYYDVTSQRLVHYLVTTNVLFFSDILAWITCHIT